MAYAETAAAAEEVSPVQTSAISSTPADASPARTLLAAAASLALTPSPVKADATGATAPNTPAEASPARSLLLAAATLAPRPVPAAANATSGTVSSILAGTSPANTILTAAAALALSPNNDNQGPRRGVNPTGANVQSGPASPARTLLFAAAALAPSSAAATSANAPSIPVEGINAATNPAAVPTNAEPRDMEIDAASPAIDATGYIVSGALAEAETALTSPAATATWDLCPIPEETDEEVVETDSEAQSPAWITTCPVADLPIEAVPIEFRAAVEVLPPPLVIPNSNSTEIFAIPSPVVALSLSAPSPTFGHPFPPQILTHYCTRSC